MPAALPVMRSPKTIAQPTPSVVLSKDYVMTKIIFDVDSATIQR
jgi:hypothetical protein